MVATVLLVILTTILVFCGAAIIAGYVGEQIEARRRKTVMDICDRIIPKLYSEMYNGMDEAMERIMKKSMEMTKKMMEMDD